MKMTEKELRSLIELTPNSERNLKRLYHLLNASAEAKIGVFGKYNHGKSTLLNAICNDEIFKAADKRETTQIKEAKARGVVWVDTPGLDADIEGNDDQKARKTAFEIADVLFLVHNVAAGELDKYELALYRQLMSQDKNYRKKLVLVLTQIDQLPDIEREQVVSEIKKQLPELMIFPVSSVRFTRGMKENKQAFINKSGMLALLDHVETIKSQISSLRKKEISRLKMKAELDLTEQIEYVNKEYSGLVHNSNAAFKKFKKDIVNTKKRIATRSKELNI
jgi:GTPase